MTNKEKSERSFTLQIEERAYPYDEEDDINNDDGICQQDIFSTIQLEEVTKGQ